MIFTVGSKKILFVHIPKCGGSTIENSLNKVSNTPIRLDHKNSSIESLWGQKESYQLQHLTFSEVLQFGYVADDFDFIFSIVRNPLDRLLSEINWQLNHEFFQYSFSIKKICDGFLSESREKFCHFKWQYDYLEGLPGNALVAKLENLDSLVHKLKQLTGIHVSFGHSNISNKLLKYEDLSSETKNNLMHICSIEASKLSLAGVDYQIN